MTDRNGRQPDGAEKLVRDIRYVTRRHFSAEEKIRIVLEGLRGEDSIAELCRKEGIAQNLYDRWSKDFLERGPASDVALLPLALGANEEADPERLNEIEQSRFEQYGRPHYRLVSSRVHVHAHDVEGGQIAQM